MMLRFSANLTFLFADRPFLDRFPAAGAAGFRSVEFMFPYEFGVEQVREVMRRAELEIDVFNLPAGNWTAGELGIAVLPDRAEEFHQGVDAALQYAQELGTRKLNCLVGRRDSALEWETQYSCAVENLSWAAARAGERGVTLHVEQLNPIEFPGFFLDNLPVVERLLSDVDSPHLRLQFDVYHVQRTQGNVVATLRRLIDRIGHVQIADSPGRGEPGTGELAYHYILDELDSLGYPGRVGLEYRPTLPTGESFGWVSENGWRLDV
jgi:hydroxypyruvate isomerase